MTRAKSLVLAAASILALGVANGAGAQTRDARSVTRPTGVISGTVVSDDTERRPVRRARVTCAGGDFAASAITDDAGAFAFRGLKAGRYTIAATKDAWIPTAYGARRPLRPGSAIALADGQRLAVVLRMLRGSVITGVVLDHDNQPATNTVVSALGYVIQSGDRRLAAAASGVSDDRGIYRIYGLAPGQYYVGAAGRSTGFNAPSSELRLAGQGGERTVAFAPTYFPGTPVAAEASAVTLGPSEEREGVDFALQLVRTARVEGTVTAVDGTPAAAGTLVNLIASAATVFPGTPFNGFRSARVGADGGFSFADVSPGNYTVLARGAAAAGSGPQDLAQIAWASTDISVDGETIDGLALGLQPAQTMTGQIRFDAERLTPPADLKAIRLTLEPVQSPGAVTLSPTGGVVDPLGHFEIAGVVPGRYRLLALLPGLGRPGQWHLRSSIVNGQDTLDVPVVIRPNESIRDAVITLTDRPAQITGAVQNAAGGAPNEYTVILFPADQTLWLPHARRIQAVRPSADGVFIFQGLPAGDYLLAAIDDVEYGEWFDPALLQRLVANALRTTVAEGEHKVQDIRLGGGS